MDPAADISAFERIFANYGVSGTLIAVFAWISIKYGPRLIEAHLAFVAAAQAQIVKTTEINERIAVRQKLHAAQTQQALDALRHSCDVIESFARGTEREPEIRQHVATIRTALSYRGSEEDRRIIATDT